MHFSKNYHLSRKKIDIYKLYFRNSGTKLNFELVSKDNELFPKLLEFGFDLTKFVKFEFILKSGIDLTQLLSGNINVENFLIDACSIFFSIKTKSDIKHIIQSLFEAFKKVNYVNKDLINIIGFILPFIRSKLKIELNSVLFFKEKEEFIKQVEAYISLFKNFIINLFHEFLKKYDLFEALKEINHDNIPLSLRIPKNKNGISLFIKIRELSNVMFKLMGEN